MIFAFYGTLRKNGPKDKTYNYERFGKGSQKYLSTNTIKGWKLLDLGYYPCVIPGDGDVVVELHEVSSDASKMIERMELNSNYQIQQIQIDDIQAFIFYQDTNKSGIIIESGDWCDDIQSGV